MRQCKTALHLVSTFRLCQSTNWHFCRLLSNPSRAEVQIKHNSIFKALGFLVRTFQESFYQTPLLHKLAFAQLSTTVVIALLFQGNTAT